jgi:F-type H+-transporting ATPase subunit delta
VRGDRRRAPLSASTAGRARRPVASAVARRYARALLEVARTPGLASPQALEQELQEFAQLLQTSGELRSALLHPALAAEARRRVVAAVAERAGASRLLAKLLELLAAHDQLPLLPAVAAAYTEALDTASGRVRAEAVTAAPLAEPQRGALASALCGAVGGSVALETQVDPDVLGGVLVRIAGRTYDGTVRTRLAALRQRLASGR